jgi:hypothetical protein
MKHRRGLITALALFVGLSTLSSVLASSMPETLEKTMSARGNWLADPNESSFFGVRCAALNMAISGYFEFHAGSDVDRRNAIIAAGDAETFLLPALFLGERSGSNQERISQQLLAISREYRQTMERNKLLINNGLHTPVIDDLTYCNRFKQNYEVLSKLLQSQEGSSGSKR